MKLISYLFFIIMIATSNILEAKQDLPSQSLYHIDDEWISQKSEKILFSSLQGDVSLVAMIFSSCPSACPLIVADLKSIRDRIEEKNRLKIKIRLFSFDDEVDTPQQLAQFYKKHKLDSQWELYSGKKAGIANLAAALEVQYKRLDRGSYAHSNQVFLVGRSGVIEAKINELGEDPAELVKKANLLLKESR